jgi:hypothetical protein
MSMDIDAEIASLYRLPPGDFVHARNELAARLRAVDRKAAAEVKKLAKPSMSAWAVNQAYWNARDEFEAMLDAGDQLRELQKRALGGERATGVQAAMAAQRSALVQVVKHATHALTQAGHGSNKAVLRRVVTTLEALAAYGHAASAPTPGRLSADVPAPGFDVLAQLAQVPVSVPASVPAAPAAPRVPAATTANDNVASEREQAEQAERERAERAARRAARERAREQARAAVDRARTELESRRQALDRAARTEKDALDEVYSAERAVAAAEQALARAVAARDAAVAGAEQAKARVEQARDQVAQGAAALVATEDALRAAQAAPDDNP